MKYAALPFRLRLMFLDVMLDPLVSPWLTPAEWAWVEREMREVVIWLLDWSSLYVCAGGCSGGARLLVRFLAEGITHDLEILSLPRLNFLRRSGDDCE